MNKFIGINLFIVALLIMNSSIDRLPGTFIGVALMFLGYIIAIKDKKDVYSR